MEAYVTEEQQLDAIKNWFKKYGNFLFWGIMTVAIVSSAFFYWRHHTQVLGQQASDHYMSLLDGIEHEDKTSIQNASDLLLKQFSTSPYATLAALTLASLSIEEENLTVAQERLEWVINHSKQLPFRALARVRLIRILIAQDKLDEALKWFDEKKANGFLTILAELRGDILVKQNDLPGARAAYLEAFNSAPEQGLQGPLLKMKMENLGIDLPESVEKANEAMKS